MFHAYTQVAIINYPSLYRISHNFSIMKVPVYITTKPSKTFFVYGYVTEQTSIHDMAGSDISKMAGVIVHL